MTLEEQALADAQAARERLEALQDEVESARAEYHRAIRRLHLAGASLREIADVLGLSHQRVHQLVGEDPAVQVLRRLAGQEPESAKAQVLRLVRDEKGSAG